MKWHTLFAAIAVAVGAATAASSQTVIDANDPAITKKPSLDVENGSPPPYPDIHHFNGGQVEMRTCIDVFGKPNGSTIIKSSGFPKADDTFLEWINESALFKPAHAGSKPVAICNWVFTFIWALQEDNAAK